MIASALLRLTKLPFEIIQNGNSFLGRTSIIIHACILVLRQSLI